MNKRKVSSLYIHIPFCTHLCDYCDFTKMFYLRKYVNPYLNLLIEQINDLGNKKFKTVYIGGGTPSTLSSKKLEKLLIAIYPHLAKKYEFTMEVNVESLSLDKLALMKQYGINRVSIGVQSFNNEILKFINRHHNKRQVKYWINKFHQIGIDNINIDLIYGLPNQTLEQFELDINEALNLNISHISSYSLTINKNTVFYNKGIKEVSDDLSREFYDLLYQKLLKAGFERYEVSNFAKNKKYSKHNLTYWNDDEYIGIGLGAHGYVDNVRYENTSNMNQYLKRKYVYQKDKLIKTEQIEDYLMLNLRKKWGFNKNDFVKRFTQSFDDIFKTQKDLLIN